MTLIKLNYCNWNNSYCIVPILRYWSHYSFSPNNEIWVDREHTDSFHQIQKHGRRHNRKLDIHLKSVTEISETLFSMKCINTRASIIIQGIWIYFVGFIKKPCNVENNLFKRKHEIKGCFRVSFTWLIALLVDQSNIRSDCKYFHQKENMMRDYQYVSRLECFVIFASLYNRVNESPGYWFQSCFAFLVLRWRYY